MAKTTKFWKIMGVSLLSVGAISIFAAATVNNSKETISQTNAASPDYSACETAHAAGNKANLLSALRTLTSSGSAKSYNDLWDAYPTVYKRSDNCIYDYYSNVSNFTKDDQDPGSGGTTEGDKYNREHTIPKSWWGGSTSNQGADIFIVVPADKLVNNKRSDNCLGVVGSSSWTSENNYSKLGTSSSTWNYFGSPVFEPNDEVKGDLARIVFYAIAKYSGSYGWTTGNGSYVFSGSASTNLGLTANAVKLFTYWNNLDKPSDWERTVNTRGNTYQGNVNPFIDHPEYVNTLWGDVDGMTTYTTSTTPGITSVTVSPSTLNLYLDGTKTGNLTANVVATGGATTTVSWSVTPENQGVTVSDGTVTASSTATTGTYTVKATSTYDSTKYGTCTVTVAATSGGGGGGESDEFTIQVSDIPSQYSSTSFTSNDVTFGCSNIGNSYTSGSMQFKSGSGYLYNTQPITNISGIKVCSSSSGSFSGTVYVGSSSHPTSGTSYSVSNGTTVNISGSPSYITLQAGTVSGGAKCGDIIIYRSSGSTEPTLSSISVSTAPTKTTYTAGEYFSPTGLVITRTYSDSTSDTYAYAGHTSEFSFTPSTSTALTTSNTSVTIGYGGKSCSQAITVNPAPATSITATVGEKTFYVGETITKDDITVKDNNNNTITSFSFTSYQFTYADANSGGALTNKTFTNGVTYNTLKCNLTVQVQRKAYATPVSSVKDTITASDLTATGTQYVDFSGLTKTSGAVYAGNSAKNGSNIQLKSKDSVSGIVSTTSGGTIASVKITVSSGSATINVYGKNTAYSAATDLYSSGTQGTLVGSTSSTGTITFSTGYAYVGIRSNSGAAYISSIEITYSGSAETPANVANYIMYTDTSGQCTSKYSVAKGYFNNLSSSDKTTFMTSSDYVIATARERLQAWAAYHGESITLSGGSYVIGSNNGMRLLSGDNSGMIIALATFGVTSVLLGLSFIGYGFKKKKE